MQKTAKGGLCVAAIPVERMILLTCWLIGPATSQSEDSLARKLSKTMRMFVFFMFLALFAAAAKPAAQTVSLSGKNLSFQQVFTAIKQQTGYVVISNKEYLSNRKVVSLDVLDMPLLKLLDLVLKDQPLKYVIRDKTIILSRKPASSTAASIVSQISFTPISIKVTDSLGKPLSGAAVAVQSRRISGVTNSEGIFMADVGEGEVLVISYVGYVTRELIVPAAGIGAITVVLKAAVSALNDIVINTGFQLVKKEKMTGATVSVGSEELEKRYTPNILDNLEGRAPGLVMYRGTTSIRGVGTINANKNPLIVLDGLPIEGSVADINPYDVENVTVLKDAAAAAIYGARAANGVIVITTRKAKGKRTAVEFSSDITVTEKPDLNFNLLTPAQQVDKEGEVYNYLYANTGGIYPNTAAAVAATDAAIIRGSSMSSVYYAYYQLAKGSISQAEFDQRIASLKQGDFRKQFTDNALVNGVLQQYNLAVRSAGDKFQSNLVLNYKTNNTGIVNAYDRQLNLFYKGGYDIARWLTANYGVNTVLGYGKASNSNFATSGLNVPAYQPHCSMPMVTGHTMLPLTTIATMPTPPANPCIACRSITSMSWKKIRSGPIVRTAVTI